jgi:hypothetical protein
MYRRSSSSPTSRRIGFSWSRLITNAFPNFARDNAEQDAELATLEQDLLWTHHMALIDRLGRSALELGPMSAKMAGVTPSEKISKRIYETMLKVGLIEPISEQNPNGINTNLITSRLPHQFAFISIAAQRKLVGMLFFWEEEVVRWRLLDDEEEEIRKVIQDTATQVEGVSADLNVHLERVLMRKNMMPSQHRAAEAADEVNPATGIKAAPPSYSA